MKKIFLILSLATIFSSCDESLLEPFTPGSMTEEVAVTNASDLNKLMNSTYNLMFSREEAVFSSVFTDEAGIGFANGGQGINAEYVFFINTASTGPSAIWNGSYFALSRANRVITFADKIYPNASTTDQAIISRLKAEALVLRALAHLKIMAYFSTDLKNDNALAGVLANRIIETSETLPRSTNGEFYAQIHSDLDNAISIFNTLTPLTYSGNSATYYANANLAKALKARAYSYKGDYTNAETWANAVINTSGITLANTSDYKLLFWNDNEPANKEVIFRLRRTAAQNSQGTNMHNGWCSVRPNLNGSPFYEVSRALFNLINPSNVPGSQFATQSDVRLITMCSATSVVDPNYTTSTDYVNTDKLIIQKYGGIATTGTPWASTATNGNNNDLKVCRLSEMYFIKAEARANAGDLPGAAAAIIAVRNARNAVSQPIPNYANATAAWADILKERRIEFAFEGYRFIDLKRLGTLAGVGLNRDAMDYAAYPGGNPANLPLSSYKWALPIPISELNANSNIQQNPGY